MGNIGAVGKGECTRWSTFSRRQVLKSLYYAHLCELWKKLAKVALAARRYRAESGKAAAKLEEVSAEPQIADA